jgi:hypothetical protein
MNNSVIDSRVAAPGEIFENGGAAEYALANDGGEGRPAETRGLTTAQEMAPSSSEGGVVVNR